MDRDAVLEDAAKWVLAVEPGYVSPVPAFTERERLALEVLVRRFFDGDLFDDEERFLFRNLKRKVNFRTARQR